MPGDDFSKFNEANADTLDASAYNAYTVTPHDTNDLSKTTRAIYIGGSGNVKLLMAGDSAAVTFENMAEGMIYPLRVKRIYSTDTTATNIIALY